MTILSNLLHGLRNLSAKVTSRLDDAAIRHRMAQEFVDLGSRDLDRVLADIGCAREDLAVLIKNAPRSRSLLEAMILRLGLEKEFALGEPLLLRDIERRCGTCPTHAICGRWLGKGGAPGEYRLFCPNAGNFDLLSGKTAA